jgi:hypothetical protein
MNSHWDRLGTPPALRQNVPYAYCPHCDEVTPQISTHRPAGSTSPFPVTLGCGPCGRLHEATDEADMITAFDTSARHDVCGTTVPCPSAAHRVRCPQRACKLRGKHYFPGPAIPDA